MMNTLAVELFSETKNVFMVHHPNVLYMHRHEAEVTVVESGIMAPIPAGIMIKKMKDHTLSIAT